MRERLDHAALNAIARTHFGVRRPVRVIRRRSRNAGLRRPSTVVPPPGGPGRYYLQGWTSYDAETGEHRMVVRSNQEAVPLLQTIAHELEHCRQRELYLQLAGGWPNAAPPERAHECLARFGLEYRGRQEHFERLAREAEARWWQLGPAVRA